MKKIIVLACFFAMGLLVVVQFSTAAGVGCGKGCQGKNQQAQQMDAETQVKYDKFLLETVDLRKEMDAKMIEYQTLMASENPDSSKAAMLTESFFQLRDTLTAKAIEAGITRQKGGCSGCSGKQGVACGLPANKGEVEKTN